MIYLTAVLSSMNKPASIPANFTGQGFVDAISTIGEVYAWPVVALVAIWVLRKDLSALLGRLKSFKRGETEALFDRKIESVAQEIEKLPNSDKPLVVASEPIPKKLKNVRQIIDEMARVSPQASIIPSWNLVEQALNKTVERIDLFPDQSPRKNHRPSMHIVRELVRLKFLSDGHLSILEEMRHLRNQIVHAMPSDGDIVSFRQATQFKQQAMVLANIIDHLGTGKADNEPLD